MLRKRTGRLLGLVIVVLLGAAVACQAPGPAAGPPSAADTGDAVGIGKYTKDAGYKPEWGQPKKGGILRYGGSHQFVGHDPNYGHSFEGPQFLPFYNSLLRFEPWVGTTGNIEGDLAESWDMAKDGLSLTFKLRKGVKFWDNPHLPAAIKDKVSGDEFKCEDAKASLEFAIDPPQELRSLHTGPRSALSHFKSASCPDGPQGYTLVVEFKEPLARTVTMFAGGRGMAHNMDKDLIDWLVKECLMCMEETTNETYLHSTGTGAFIPVEYQKDVITKVRRNPTYWREGLPLLDGMDQFIMKDFTARFTALVTGQIDYFGEGSASLLPGQVVEAARFKNKIVVQPTLHTWGKGIQLNMNRKPLDDVRVRKALHLALDRDAWAEFNKAGDLPGVVRPTNWMPPGTAWALPEKELMSLPGWRRDKKAEDIAEANRLLDEAGLRRGPDGVRFKTSCMAESSQQYIDGCTFVKDQWKRTVGVEVAIDAVQSAVQQERGRAENYEMHYGSKAVTNVGDPDDWYLISLVPEFESYYYQATGAEKAAPELARELERMVRAQSGELDPAKRVKRVHEIERKLATEAFFAIPLPWTNIFPAWSKDVRGWNLGPFPSQVKDAQWERVWLAR